MQMNIETATVAKSRAGKSRARSEWAHSRVFSSDEEDIPTGRGARTARASLWGDGAGKNSRTAKSQAALKKVTCNIYRP